MRGPNPALEVTAEAKMPTYKRMDHLFVALKDMPPAMTATIPHETSATLTLQNYINPTITFKSPACKKNWACSACHCCCCLAGPNHLAKPKKSQVARTDDHENLSVYSQCPAALKPQSSTNEGMQGEIRERQNGRARVGRGIASC